MNKQTIIITIIVGLAAGMFLAFQNNSKPEHASHTVMQESTHKLLDKTAYKAALTHYFELQSALANDSLETAQQTSQALAEAVSQESKAAALAHDIQHAQTIQAARLAFEALSIYMEKQVRAQGVPKDISIVKYYCPMAHDNKGAAWLQNEMGTSNPYFGAEMPTCGSYVETLK